jgi:cytidine deaminase
MAKSSSKALSKSFTDEMIESAKQAAIRAYAPYSHFHVGAAALFEGERIHSGANVENASYGLTNCAERVAIGAAVASGARRLRCLVIYTPTKTPTAPCGACRQVIREFGPDCRILSTCESNKILDTTISKLLPSAFGPENL